jgi:UMP-CMP kinase
MEVHGFHGGRFLIDGFPRNLENLNNWEKIMGEKVDVPFILHLVCSEEVMMGRLLKRGETSMRSDDNIDIIKKRFRTYNEETLEIITHYDGLGKNRDVNSEREVKVIFEDIEKIFKQHQLI